jgi:hypothetical protein
LEIVGFSDRRVLLRWKRKLSGILLTNEDSNFKVEEEKEEDFDEEIQNALNEIQGKKEKQKEKRRKRKKNSDNNFSKDLPKILKIKLSHLIHQYFKESSIHPKKK